MNQQLLDSLPENIKKLLNGDKPVYEEAFQQASTLNDKKAVAELFLEDEFNDVWPELQKSKDILVKLCTELDSLDNEFIDFTKLYKDINQSVPTREGYVALNNLFSRGVIDEHDLNDTSKENTTSSYSILFNNDIYNKRDIEFLITTYYWLSQKNNQSRMNLESLSTGGTQGRDNVPQSVMDVAASYVDYNTSGEALKNAIMYKLDTAEEARKDTDFRHFGVRDKNEVERILKVAANRNTANNPSSTDNVTNILAGISKLSDAEKKELYNRLGL